MTRYAEENTKEEIADVCCGITHLLGNSELTHTRAAVAVYLLGSHHARRHKVNDGCQFLYPEFTRVVIIERRLADF